MVLSAVERMSEEVTPSLLDHAVQGCLLNRGHYLLLASDSRITKDESEDLSPVTASLLAPDVANVKADELHQI